MSDDHVITDRHDDGVVVLRLNRPPMNPLSISMLGALQVAAETLAADDAVKAVVVAGSDKALAVGADIGEFDGQEAARRIGDAFRHSFDAVAAIPRPVVAAIRGYALGGGLELAMACDLRVASDKSRLGQPEILLGVVPGAGGTQRLPRLIGPARAKDLIWSGRQVRADEAVAIGLVDKVVADDEVEPVARHWAGELAKGAVAAMGLAKRAIDDGLGLPLAAGLDLEAEAWVDVFGTADAEIGVASFREHGPGKARFTGR